MKKSFGRKRRTGTRVGIRVAAWTAIGLCAGRTHAANLYDSYDTSTDVYAGASFVTNFGEQVTLSGANTQYDINGISMSGLAWSANTVATQDLFVAFYSGANLSSSATSVLGASTYLGYRGYSLTAPSTITSGSFYNYNLTFSTPVVVPSNTFTVVFTTTNPAINASGTELSGILSTGTPTIGTNPGFCWLNNTFNGTSYSLFGDFTGAQQYGYNIAMAINASSIGATTYLWNSSAGGNWESTTSWNPNTPAGGPTSSDNAVFNLSSATGYTVGLNSPNDTCNNLSVQSDNLTLALSPSNSGALTVVSALTVGQPPSSTSGTTVGTLSLTKSGIGNNVNVTAKTIVVGATGAVGTLNIGNGVQVLASSNVSVGAGSSLNILNGGQLSTGTIILAGSTNAWTGKVDITSNYLDLPAATLATVTNQVAGGYNLVGGANWNGPGGITSSTAATDSSHLTAVGVIQNNQSGSPIYGNPNSSTLPSFGVFTPGAADILVKYTYYGDANLDGVVDGSDYTLIDTGYASNQPGYKGPVLSGWYNGDFNYDGVIDGSDYALIDNAFNNQGNADVQDFQAGGEAIAASSTAQVAPLSAVPEPTSLAVFAILAAAAGKRVRRRHSRVTGVC